MFIELTDAFISLTYNPRVCPARLYCQQYNVHFEADLDTWTLGKITASKRLVLMTKWIGAAWDILCEKYKETI